MRSDSLWLVDICLGLCVITLILCIIGSFVVSHKQESLLEFQVKTGELSLHCLLRGKGMTLIEPNKVESHSEGRWYFTNGSATNCILGLLNE